MDSTRLASDCDLDTTSCGVPFTYFTTLTSCGLRRLSLNASCLNLVYRARWAGVWSLVTSIPFGRSLLFITTLDTSMVELNRTTTGGILLLDVGLENLLTIMAPNSPPTLCNSSLILSRSEVWSTLGRL